MVQTARMAQTATFGATPKAWNDRATSSDSEVVVTMETRDSDSIVDHNQVYARTGSLSATNLFDCPCCHQSLENENIALNEPARRKRRSLFTDTLTDDEDEDDSVQEEHDLNSSDILVNNVVYVQRKVLVEGWVHKKGTGLDMLRSTAWKPRWARLVLARAQKAEVDSPMLLISWFPSSTTPSTVIMLESTVVLSVDMQDKEQWNSYRFEIRQATNRNVTIPTRTFTIPKKGRDAWVYAISQALLVHEKQKAAIRKANNDGGCNTFSPGISNMLCTTTSTSDGNSSNDPNRFLTIETNRPMSPPNSPPTSPRMGRSRESAASSALRRTFSPPRSPSSVPRPDLCKKPEVRRFGMIPSNSLLDQPNCD